MKRIILFSAALLFCGTVDAQQSTHGTATLTGTVEGWGNDTLAVYRIADNAPLGIGIPNGREVRDIVVAHGGRFEYSMPTADTTFITVLPLNKVLSGGPIGDYLPTADRVDVLLRPGGNIAVKGGMTPEGIRYSREGGDPEELWNRYDLENGSLHRQFDLLFCSFLDLIIELKNQRAPGSNDVKQLESALASMRTLSSEIEAADKKFVSENADNATEELSPITLKFIPRLSAATRRNGLLTMFDSFPKQIAQFVRERTEKNEEFTRTVAPDGNIPDFTLNDIRGRSFTLSSLPQDKYVVLDFWGSWCAPCIAAMPKMKEYYEKHSGKLEIVGIACHDVEDNWKKAVANLALPWINVIDDAASPEGNVAARYGIKSFPSAILLAPDKTFIGLYDSWFLYEKLDELLGE